MEPFSARRLGPRQGGGAGVAASCCAGAAGDSSSDGWSSSSSSDDASLLGEMSPSTTRVGMVMSWCPLLRINTVIDSEDATYVLVFTRAKEPGIVNPSEKITKPLERAKRIFVQPEDQKFEGLGYEPVAAAVYHEKVRQRIQDLLCESGFAFYSFSSVDGDETFLVIYLDPEGETACKLAENFEYEMPISRDNYESAKSITNKGGWTCFAHTAFTRELHKAGKLQPFRRVDLIRIAYQHLSSLFDLEELRRQKFIETHFPVAGFHELRALEEHFILPLHCLRHSYLPRQIRDYFGEKIGFFFLFFVFYIRSLFVLGLIAACLSWVEWVQPVSVLNLLRRLDDDAKADDFAYFRYSVKVGLGAAVVIWAILFEITLDRSITRTAQAWGMRPGTVKVMETDLRRRSFDPALVGTPKEINQSRCAALCTGSYVALYLCIVTAINSEWLVQSKLRVFRSSQEAKTWLVSAFIVLAKKVWSYLAQLITDMENHKTQKRYDDALLVRLSGYKLFFFVWPPLSIFLFDGFAKAHCAANHHDAVEKHYGTLLFDRNASADKWPFQDLIDNHPNLPNTWNYKLNNHTYKKLLADYWLPDYAVALRNYMLLNIKEADTDSQVCLSYCLPVGDCVRVSHGRVDCKTNCHEELEEQILTMFILHFGTSILFVAASSAMILYAIRKEVSVAKRSSSKDPSRPPQSIEYTALEVQAKRHKIAPYKYLDWGGSYVEDFLEIVLGYAYISIFALVSPTMIVIAAVSQLLEFALLGIRMRFITGRPYPHAAEGIGDWKKVIVMIGTVAVFFNGYIAAFVMRPTRVRDFHERLLVFLLFGSGSLILRTVIRTAAPELPYDVRVVKDRNGEVLRKLRPVDANVEFERRRCSSHADIGLRPGEDSVRRAPSSSL